MMKQLVYFEPVFYPTKLPGQKAQNLKYRKENIFCDITIAKNKDYKHH